jgi:hypothetical protein
MKKHLIEIKILPETHRLLRRIAVLKHEAQYHVLQRLVQAEADQVLKETLARPRVPVNKRRQRLLQGHGNHRGKG